MNFLSSAHEAGMHATTVQRIWYLVKIFASSYAEFESCEVAENCLDAFVFSMNPSIWKKKIYDKHWNIKYNVWSAQIKQRSILI